MQNQNDVLKGDNTNLSNCTFIKTILMLIIIFYHSILFWSGNWFTAIKPVKKISALNYLAVWLNTFHVHTFTFVSGYIYYYLRYENKRYNNFGKFIFNKIKRLIIPYLFASSVWVIPISQHFFHRKASEIIINFALGIDPSQLWFLLMLFDVFILFHLLSNFLKEHTLLGFFLVCVLYGSGRIGQIILPNIMQCFLALKYTIFFFIGFKFRQSNALGKIKKSLLFIIVLFEISLTVIFLYYENNTSLFSKITNIGIEFILSIVGTILFFTIFYKLADQINWKACKIFQSFSKISMPMYLFHQQIIYFVIFLFNGINAYVNAILNFIISLGISFLLSNVLMRFKITRFLIGEK